MKKALPTTIWTRGSMKARLRIILDTNILLVSISSKSKYHWIFKAFLEERYDLAVSNSILIEYKEIITKKMGSEVADEVVRALIALPHVHKMNPYFDWDLIENDRDDNKFVDCAVASNVNYIVTEDKHFNVLKNIPFPRVEIINIKQFKKLLDNYKLN